MDNNRSLAVCGFPLFAWISLCSVRADGVAWRGKHYNFISLLKKQAVSHGIVSAVKTAHVRAVHGHPASGNKFDGTMTWQMNGCA
jgi:hypothetical protein